MKLALPMLLLLLSACAGAYRWDAASTERERQPAPESYVVQRGDTLYSIAWRYGMDYRELAKRNGVGRDYLIRVGQELALSPASSSSSSSSTLKDAAARDDATPVNVSRTAEPMPAMLSDWRWPTHGPLLARFGDANATGKGIAIGGAPGEAISAAADGKVVYAGSGLIGYGKIIIVKHSEEYLSAYGHNETLYVREGEQVKQGDRIAAMGRGPGNKPLLHFEIRRNGTAVDPLKYLPVR